MVDKFYLEYIFVTFLFCINLVIVFVHRTWWQNSQLFDRCSAAEQFYFVVISSLLMTM